MPKNICIQREYSPRPYSAHQNPAFPVQMAPCSHSRPVWESFCVCVPEGGLCGYVPFEAWGLFEVVWMVLDMQASVSTGLYKRMWYRTELGVGQGLRADVSHTWNGFENSAWELGLVVMKVECILYRFSFCNCLAYGIRVLCFYSCSWLL